MLDRTKLEKTGVKYRRVIHDQEYADELLVKFILLGCEYRRRTYTETVLIPHTFDRRYGMASAGGCLIARKLNADDTRWVIYTKTAHDFLEYHTQVKPTEVKTGVLWHEQN